MTPVAALPPVAVSPGRPAGGARWIGVDLPGARLRLEGAGPREQAVLASQLGIPPAEAWGDADVTIRFVDRLALAEPVRYVGLDAGFSGDAFLVLRGRHKEQARVLVPFDQLGGPCELTCERGISAIPLLLAVVNLAVLANGGVAVHGSAFRHRGRGVLVTGWAKGGKTEALLGFAARGADYVGDEWVYLDGERMRGVPEPIRLWDWHLRQLPSCEAKLPRGRRARLLALRRASAMLGFVGSRVPRASRAAARAAALLDGQRYAHLSPRVLFAGQAATDAPLDQVFLVTTRAGGAVTVEPAGAAEVAERMAISIEDERAPLLSFYRRFRFAFPHRRNRLLERAGEIERDRLRQWLRGRECHLVCHPYPPSIPDLYAALRPVVEREDHECPARPWSPQTP